MLSKKIVVLTPVKNEAWILPLFCKSASIWADYIVIADQGSTDSSREIVKEFSKVALIENDSLDLDENYRDKILLEKAREIAGTNAILFRLDADEILTPNFESTEWDEIKQSPAGTFWRFKWLQLYPGFAYYWENNTAFGVFVDDGREYNGHGIIHSREIFPRTEEDEEHIASEIQLLHFQFVDWARMQSKHRYYQCFEHITFPTKSAIEIFRKYHWMYNSDLPHTSVLNSWMEGYDRLGIDLKDISFEEEFWWDKKVDEYLATYSPKCFRHFETYKPSKLLFAKGKNVFDVLLLAYLESTKRIYNRKKGILRKIVRKIDHVLQFKFHI